METGLFDDILSDADAANSAPEETPQPDELAEALLAHKLAPNDFLLNLNRGLTVPYDMEPPAPWNLPSRMFRFPIEVTGDPQTDGYPRRIGLVHPLLVDHPYVQQVQAVLGIEICPDGAPNQHGYTKCNQAMWWHAVDLIGRWRDLLETRQFTTPECIAGAVNYGLSYSPHEGKRRNGYISTIDARNIMAEIGFSEPEDRLGMLRQFWRPSPCEKRWPVNYAAGDAEQKAWALIIGIDAAWFAHDRSGYIGWTQVGRDKFASVVGMEAAVQPEPVEPLKVAEPEPKPAAKPQQLTLF